MMNRSFLCILFSLAAASTTAAATLNFHPERFETEEDAPEFFQTPAMVEHSDETPLEPPVPTRRETEKLDPSLAHGGSWSYSVKYFPTEGKPRTLAAYRVGSVMEPASVMKLFTGWMAFQKKARPMDYLQHMLQHSDNDEALDTFVKLGGARKVTKFVSDTLTVSTRNFRVYDGSGLSHSSRLTIGQLMSLLQEIHSSEHYDSMKKLLAQPGERGTLHYRLRDVAYPIYAKTGTLWDTISLAGFVELNHGTMHFAIIYNKQEYNRKKQPVPVNKDEIRGQVDELVRKYIKIAEEQTSQLETPTNGVEPVPAGNNSL